MRDEHLSEPPGASMCRKGRSSGRPAFGVRADRRRDRPGGPHLESKIGSGEMRWILVTIRRADGGDANLLADLGRRTFYETFAASNKAEDMDDYSGAAFAIGRIAGELRQRGTTFFIAETTTKPVGFAKLEAARPPGCVTGPSPVRLHKLYVSADAIGTGVGSELMRFVIDWEGVRATRACGSMSGSTT